MRLSGLQVDVLKLYRVLLRTCRKHPNCVELKKLVSIDFREKANSVDRTNYKVIEHTLRWGYKQKKMLEGKGFAAAATKSIR